MNPDLLLAGIAVVWVALAFGYWRNYAISPQTRFVAYDRLAISLLAGVGLARLVAVAVDYSLFIRPINWAQVFNFLDLNFLYILLPVGVMLGYQFYSFNIQLDPDWYKKSFPTVWFGLGLVLPISFIQLVRAISLDWPREFLGLHVGHILVVLLALVLAWWINKQKQMLSFGVLIYVVQVGGMLLVYYVSRTIAIEELNLYFSFSGISLLVLALPYLTYNLGRIVRSKSNGV